MMRLSLKKKNSGDKENVPQSRSKPGGRRRNLAFRRKRKENRGASNPDMNTPAQPSTSTGSTSPEHDQPDSSTLPSSKPLFSALSEMAIIHNSISNFALPGDTDEDSQDAHGHVSASPSMISTTVTGSVMKLSTQSRMYDEMSTSRSYADTWENLCDDPTVEESIECVFEHQLEDGLEMIVEDDTDSSSVDIAGMSTSTSCCSFDEKKHYTSGKLMHVGSFSPIPRIRKSFSAPVPAIVPATVADHTPRSASAKRSSKNNVLSPTASVATPKSSNLSPATKLKFNCHAREKCRDDEKAYISVPPEKWPQAPLFLRATPGSCTKIIGVRYANETKYLRDESRKQAWWDMIPNKMDRRKAWPLPMSPNNCCLPINNGNEKFGRTLVIDFESRLFQGTMQLRIRKTNGTTPELYDDSIGYFKGLNRHYQCIIQGRFKRDDIPMVKCMTGQAYSKPLKLPPPYITKSGIRIGCFFAPQFQARLDGDTPYMMSPLGSTPQTVIAVPYRSKGNGHETFRANESISAPQEEPVEASRRLIQFHTNEGMSSVSRAKARKKAFDRLCTERRTSITFQTNRVYTFEFLQHLVDFENFDLSLGSILGKMSLCQVMNGQPLNIMAGYQRSRGQNVNDEDKFWSFDVWHESIFDTMLKRNEYIRS